MVSVDPDAWRNAPPGVRQPLVAGYVAHMYAAGVALVSSGTP